jgi:hypothetical protein
MAGWCGGEVGGGAERRGTKSLLLLLVAIFCLLDVGAAEEVKARFKTVEILVTEYQPQWEDEVWSQCTMVLYCLA